MIKFFCIFILLFFMNGQAQQVTRAQLAEALQSCEQDLDSSRTQIEVLRDALNKTQLLIDTRKNVSDSLISNLRYQIIVQDSITGLLKTNSDTLQMMIVDYRDKLDEVNNLYISELKKQTRPWFLSQNGLKGLSYGLFIGAALGLIFAVAL